MRKLKRSECAVLPLVLKKRWFDMIALGKKREEYREYTWYWECRIRTWIDKSKESARELVVELRHGYAENAPRVAYIVENVRLRRAYWFKHPEWGEPCGEHYVLCLGERVKLVEGDEQ